MNIYVARYLRSAFGSAARPTFVGLALVLVCALAGAAHATAISHVPPAEATAGTPVELVAEAPPSTPTLRLFYRAHLDGPPVPFISQDLVRKDDAHWVAIVPAQAVAMPGFDYYIAAGEEPVFASPAWPHTMPVIEGEGDARRTRDAARADHRRSHVGGNFEYVDFGSRNLPGSTTKVIDRYYRVDADFAYRLWAYPVEELRVGYTRLIGDVKDGADNGFRVGGWFELGLAPVEGVRADARVMVLATQSGFAPGFRGEMRLGDRDASHVAAGVEYLADVGTNGFFRLGWGTVPGVPMSATVEITNLPSDAKDVGVRLYYDIAHAIVPGVRLGIRVGYAARDQEHYGFTSGGNVVVDF
ncbi:hypothetical protein BH11MYX2_BH11MYX2_39810 [soil metagenome]